MTANDNKSMIVNMWIARDGNGKLYLYENQPVLRGSDTTDWLYFESKDIMEGYVELPIYMFPEITFENSPQKIKLELVKE